MYSTLQNRSEHCKRPKDFGEVVIYTVPFALWARSVRMAEEAFPAKELQANPYRMPSGGHIFYSGVVVNVLVAACSIAGAVLNRGH